MDQTEKNKQLVKEALTKMIGNLQCDPATIGRYFSSDYIQYVDKKVLDLHGLISHMGQLPERFQSMKVTFIALISEGNNVFSSHIVDVLSRDGVRHVMHSMAFFRVKDNMINHCTELTRFIENPVEDKMLQSFYPT